MRAVWLPLMLTLCGFDLLRRPSPEVEEGNRAYGEKKFDEALASYGRAKETLSKNSDLRFNAGTALLALGRVDEAIGELEEAARRGAGAKAHYNLGNAYFGQGRFADAIEAYRRALRIDPTDRRAKWNLELALRKKQEEEAQEQREQEQQKERHQEQEQQEQPEQPEQQEDGQQEQGQQEQGQQGGEDPEEQPDRGENEPGHEEAQPQSSEPDLTQDESQRAQDAARADEAVLDAIEQAEKNLQIERLRKLYRKRRVEKDW